MQPRLLRVSDNSGSVSVDAVDTGDRLTKAALSSDDVFIVDTGSKVFVWVGKGASPAEKRESMLRATAYVQQVGRLLITACTTNCIFSKGMLGTHLLRELQRMLKVLHLSLTLHCGMLLSLPPLARAPLALQRLAKTRRSMCLPFCRARQWRNKPLTMAMASSRYGEWKILN